jgi:hypothetical protein
VEKHRLGVGASFGEIVVESNWELERWQNKAVRRLIVTRKTLAFLFSRDR